MGISCWGRLKWTEYALSRCQLSGDVSGILQLFWTSLHDRGARLITIAAGMLRVLPSFVVDERLWGLVASEWVSHMFRRLYWIVGLCRRFHSCTQRSQRVQRTDSSDKLSLAVALG